MTYKIEQPIQADAKELAEVHNQSWLETYPNEELGITEDFIDNWTSGRLTEDGLKRREAAIQSSRDSSTYFLRVARNEAGKIVGFVDGRIKDGEWWLDGLYTLKNTHGTDLGKLLLGAYLTWAEGHDILLTVATYNERAKAFYRKIGFIEKPGTERTFGDTPIPVIDMVCKVSS